MEISYVYNSNRSQVEASMYNDTGIVSTYIMDVKEDWSKKEFFENIGRFVFYRYYASFEAIVYLMQKIYGELTKDEIKYYSSYLDELRGDISSIYFG